MELNTEIWGTYEDNAVELDSSRNIYYSNKSGAGSIGEYRTSYGMEEPIDESVNIWQLADFSMFNSVAYCRRDGNNTPILDVCRSIMPKSIFLSIAPSVYNMTFNPTQGSNLMWSPDVSNSIYTGTNYKILPWFDYNNIMAIFQLITRKFDSDGKPTGSNVYRDIYSYYHDNDNDDLPLTTNWKIIGLNVRFAHLISGNLYAPFSENVSVISSAKMPYPQPNYYYSTGNYISYNALRYANGVDSLGSQSVSNAGGYGSQQGAYGQSNNAYIYGYSSDSWEKESYLNNSNQLIEYFSCTLNYEEMLRQCSTLGFWFNETISTTSSANSWTNILGEGCTDDHVILPEILNGRTTGNYKRGRQAGADPQASWGIDWRDNVNYTGDVPYDQESEKTEFPAYVISVPAFGKTYVFDYTNISVLGERLKNFGQTEYDPKVFYNQNPIECIGFIKVFPFSNFQMRACLEGSVTSRTNSIFIGLWDSEVPAGYTQIKSTDMSTPIWEGEDTISPKWGDFRDFEPYSKYSLYLPFCGTIEIPATIILNNKITVKYSLDVLSGQVTAYVLINDILYCTASGNCALEVPIDGYRVADYKSDMLNLETSKIIAKTNFGNDIAMSLRGSGNALMTEGINRKHIANPLVTTGGVTSALGSAVQAFSSTMQNLATYKKYSQLVDYTAPAPAFISSGSGLGAWCNPLNVQVIIQRPKMLQFNEEIYAKTTGYACCIYDKLNSQQEEGKDNFVQVNDIILDDIPLTENEKTNLLSLLQSGVII